MFWVCTLSPEPVLVGRTYTLEIARVPICASGTMPWRYSRSCAFVTWRTRTSDSLDPEHREYLLPLGGRQVGAQGDDRGCLRRCRRDARPQAGDAQNGQDGCEDRNEVSSPLHDVGTVSRTATASASPPAAGAADGVRVLEILGAAGFLAATGFFAAVVLAAGFFAAVVLAAAGFLAAGLLAAVVLAVPALRVVVFLAAEVRFAGAPSPLASLAAFAASRAATLALYSALVGQSGSRQSTHGRPPPVGS